MKTPNSEELRKKRHAEIAMKVIGLIAEHGDEAVFQYLDTFPVRFAKKSGKHLGAYIVNKICEEYRITQYDLFESTERLELSEARQVLCVLMEKYLEFDKAHISRYFNRSRHFAKRNILGFIKILEENHPIQHKLIARYKRLDLLISAYTAFKPQTK